MKAEGSSKILMIAYYLPPMGTVGVLRNTMMHKCFCGIFEKVFAISIKNITLPASTKLIDKNAEVHRVFNWDYRNIMNLLSRKNKDLRKNVNARSDSFIVRFFRRVADSFPCNTIIGEGGLFYIFNGTFKGISLVRKHRITHIYSSFRPLADHIIAYNLKLIFPKLIWIADFRDLPVDQYRENTVFPTFQWKIITIMMTKADIRTTVSEGLKRVLDKNSGKTEVLMNGIYDLYKPTEFDKKDKFTVLYTGSLYPKYGKPAMLLEAIRSLLEKKLISFSNFRLIYAGKDSLVWNDWVSEYRLNEICITQGEISFSESVQHQFSSHILLLFTWAGKENSGVLTGKVFEYLATENPILAIVNGEKDTELETILNELKAGSAFYEGDKNQLEELLLVYYMQWMKTGEFSHRPNSDRLEKHSWKSRQKQLTELLGFSGNA